jgi:pyruvate/2-oxoglutarate dehydrogenase complex dihydrolipoamide acyltransferase (E2) component
VIPISDIPNAEELKRILIAAHSEAWLQTALKEHEDTYGGSFPDMAMKYWMIATENGIDVPEIRAAASDQEGTPLKISELTDKRIVEEIEANERKDSSLYSVGPLLITSDPEEGATSVGKPKVEFYAQDDSGRIKIVARGDSISIVANSRIKQGDVVKLPLVSVFAGAFEDDATRYWKQLTIPPFGRIERVEGMDFKAFYKDPRKDPLEDGDAIYLEGVVTVLDPKENIVCSVCTRWVNEGKEAAHEKCGAYETRTEVSYEGTLATGSAQVYRVISPAWLGEPDIPVASKGKPGRVRAYGTWNGKYKNLRIQRFEVLPKMGPRTAPTQQKPPTSTPAPAAPAAAPAAAKPKPKPAPGKSAAPPPPPPAPALEKTQDAPDIDSGIASAIIRVLQKKGGNSDYESLTSTVSEALEIEKDDVVKTLDAMTGKGDRIEEKPLGAIRLTTQPTAAKAPPAKEPAKKPTPAPAPVAKAEPEEEEEDETPERQDDDAAADTGAEMPAKIRQHIVDTLAGMAGRARTQVVVNLAMNENLVSVSEDEIKKHGDKEAAQRERMHAYLDQAAKDGIMAWDGKWTQEGDVRKPPKWINSVNTDKKA